MTRKDWFQTFALIAFLSIIAITSQIAEPQHDLAGFVVPRP